MQRREKKSKPELTHLCTAKLHFQIDEESLDQVLHVYGVTRKRRNLESFLPFLLSSLECQCQIPNEARNHINTQNERAKRVRERERSETIFLVGKSALIYHLRWHATPSLSPSLSLPLSCITPFLPMYDANIHTLTHARKHTPLSSNMLWQYAVVYTDAVRDLSRSRAIKHQESERKRLFPFDCRITS